MFVGVGFCFLIPENRDSAVVSKPTRPSVHHLMEETLTGKGVFELEATDNCKTKGTWGLIK